MPITPPLLDEQESLNAWLDQTTEEVNELIEARAVTLAELQLAASTATDFASFQTLIAALI